jgi:N,N'-diacetyllegionaminate synthase
MEAIRIDDRLIGPGQPPFFIAEIGSNHNGDMGLARNLIDAAVGTGADAVKFQSWSKSSLVCKAEFARNTKYEDSLRHFGSLEEMVEKYQLTPAQHRELSVYCAEKGVLFVSTPFSRPEVDLLDELGIPFFKIASMDVNNLSLLAHVGSKGKPVIISTGMATLGEIERAMVVLREAGSGPLCLLHCISVYPPKFEDINLKNIPMLQTAFNVPVGFSDHSQGTAIPLAALALGACVMEKHFTLDHEMPGWDHWVSADPGEMRQLVTDGRNIHMALGSEVRTVNAAEQAKKLAFRRCCVAARSLPVGHLLSETDLDFKRPGAGINPDEARYVIGRSLKRALDADDILSWDDLL